jgi:hypothetical protein
MLQISIATYLRQLYTFSIDHLDMDQSEDIVPLHGYSPLTIRDLDNAKKHLSRKKAIGRDALSNQMMHEFLLKDNAKDIFLRKFNIWWLNSSFPSYMKSTRIVSLSKRNF